MAGSTSGINIISFEFARNRESSAPITALADKQANIFGAQGRLVLHVELRGQNRDRGSSGNLTEVY